jgi:hypothetical protein
MTTSYIAERHVDSTASRQWANRPADERYLSLADLHAAVSSRRAISRQVGLALQHTEVLPTAGGDLQLVDQTSGLNARLTHESFGSLCGRVGAPAGYLRELPAELAAVNLSWGLRETASDARALVLAPMGGDIVRAVTSDTYGRIWDADLVGAIVQATAGQPWQVPAASYASSDPKRASTLYASDRDVFVFLVDPTRPIVLPGETKARYRGFYAWNSETGDRTLGLASFLYEYVCDNRNIWGQSEFREIKVPHRSGAPARMAREIRPQLAQLAQASDRIEVAGILAAQSKEVAADKPGVVSFLRGRGFSVKLAEGAYESAERSNANPRSVWGLMNGLTDQAHEVKHQGDRVDLERQAAKLMSLVAA